MDDAEALGKQFFDEHVEKYGTHSRAQGFSYPVSQTTQFDSVKAHVGRVSGGKPISLLDLAGGTGDLLLYLDKIEPTLITYYSCADNQPILLEEARHRAAGLKKAYMFTGDLFDPDMPPHDYVVCLGLYAMWHGGQADLITHIDKLLTYMAIRATGGISINFVSPWADFYEEYNKPISPVVPITILKKLGFERIWVDLTTAPHLYMVHALAGQYAFRKDWGVKTWDTE